MTIDTSAVLRQFDRLIEQGELFYTASKPSFVTDGGVEFEFLLSPSFASKPTFSSNDTAQSSRRPPPTDGSDIDHSDPAFFVAEIQTTHKLILNKFCMFRPQFLLLTLDPKRRQTEVLGEEDMSAVWSVLGELDGVTALSNGDEAGKGKGKGDGKKHYAVFNGGPEAGSSRKHKHLQILAQPTREEGNLPLIGYNTMVLRKLGIVAFFEPLERLAALSSENAGSELARIMEEHYAGCRRALGMSDANGRKGGEQGGEEGGELLPHNLMLTRDWLITVPRTRATLQDKRLEGHIVGCQGVLGSVWAGKEGQIEAWKSEGPRKVVGELCVPGSVGGL